MENIMLAGALGTVLGLLGGIMITIFIDRMDE